MMVVCKDGLERVRSSERMGMEAAAAVEADITALLSGKTHEGLASLQRKVQEKLTSGEPVDTDYWENLLKKLVVWKAKVGTLWMHILKISDSAQAKLKTLHEVVVRNRLEQLRKRQRDEALQAQEELLAGVAKSASKKAVDNAVRLTQLGHEEVSEETEPYDRALSPEVLDVAHMSTEDRQIDTVN
jgi:hypothetical protein